MVSQTSFFNRCLLRACFSIWLLAAACGPISTPMAEATCVPPIPDANPYLSNEITAGVKNIRQKSLTDLGSARQEALFQLGQNMQHWSEQVDVVNDTSHMVRIVVTYLDPVLIQYIVLNHLLNDPNYLSTVINNSAMSENSFNFEINKTLEDLGERKEMLFIVTITSPFYRQQAYNSTDLTVKFPIDQMTLSSASKIQVKPTHFDPILNENMDINQGSVSGIVGFPIAMASGDQCNPVIDQWTNTMTLDIPSVTLGGTSYEKKFWSIPYHSVILQSDIHPTPTYDPFILSKSINKLDEPPTPSWTPNPTTIEDAVSQVYWENMGRYIWNVLITESHH